MALSHTRAVSNDPESLPEGVHGQVVVRGAVHKGRPGYFLSGASTRDGRFPQVHQAIRCLIKGRGEFLPNEKWWFVPRGGEGQIRQAIAQIAEHLARVSGSEGGEDRQPTLDPARLNARGGYEGGLFKGEGAAQTALAGGPRNRVRSHSHSATGQPRRRATKTP